ncbi:unnamed protein product [Sphacelaria rigidula]
MMGLITPEAIWGFKYMTKLTDFLTRSKYVYLTQSKVDALKTFQTFIHTEVIPRGARVKRLRADKGGEYTENEFHTYCSRVRIDFKVGLQGLTAQLTMEVEQVAGALAITEAVYYSNMIIEMGCG